ncbi:conserved hypothetical protein [Burkholderia mallei GB8 horse 4]|nr:conserved hypothetical protein [Burkholderia mallei GB8 horse 4]
MTKSQRASRGAKSNRSNLMENEIISRRHATHAASMRDIKSAFAPPTPSNRAHFRRTIALSTRAAPPGTPPPPAPPRIESARSVFDATSVTAQGALSVEYAKAMPQQRKKICTAILNASSQDELLRMRLPSVSTNERP